MRKIGWIGLGTMGVPMAKNLAAKGYPVAAYNRTPRDLDIAPAIPVKSVAEAVTEADVVILMVSDGAAVRSVLFGDAGAVQHMEPGTLVVNMSTIGVDDTKQIALELADHQIEWMDAPVSGSLKPAQDAALVVLAGGSDSAFERMKPLFLAMGKSAHHLGPIGSGATMKLLVNAFLGMVVESASECLAAADKSGLGRDRLLEVLPETAMWSPLLAGKRQLWQDNEYPAAFALKHMTKDLGLMSGYATQVSASMPAMMAVLATYLAAQANDLAEADMAAVYRQLGQASGIQ